MLQVHDIRESKVYQEALEEGAEKHKIQMISRMSSLKYAPEDIAAILELDVDLVRKKLAKNPS